MAEQLHLPVEDEEWLSQKAHDSIRGRSLRELEEEDFRLTALSPEEQTEIKRWHYNETKKRAH